MYSCTTVLLKFTNREVKQLPGQQTTYATALLSLPIYVEILPTL